MAYSTGTAANPTALKTIIENFATSNGWSLSGSDYLGKGINFVKLTVPAGPSTTTLQIVGANDASGGTPCSYVKGICIQTSSWPVTYFLFANTTPDELTCVLNYETDKIQKIVFGNITKVHSSAYNGGNYYFATKTALNTNEDTGLSISDSGYGGAYYGDSAELFAFKSNVGQATPIFIDIDGYGWRNSGQNFVGLTDQAGKCFYRSPNTWNSQTHLVPISLGFYPASGYTMPLGYVGHTRLIRVDNYDLGEIITLGADKWKVFPSFKKDSLNRNGNGFSSTGTGTMGFAVRYDGP